MKWACMVLIASNVLALIKIINLKKSLKAKHIMYVVLPTEKEVKK